MKKKYLRIILVALIAPCLSFAQATFTAAGTYSQDFSGITWTGSFTDNSTVLGWYSQNCTWQGLETYTTSGSTVNNAGGAYGYDISGGIHLFGLRPSNTQPGGPCNSPSPNGCPYASVATSLACYMGLRIKNNSNAIIPYINITFDWHQLSVAEDESTPNTDYVDYRIGATVTSTLTGAWTQIPSLSYTAPIDEVAADGSSNQDFALPCKGGTITVDGTVYSDCQKQTVSACILVNIPKGDEIMIRWSDPNNNANDPHIAITNVVVGAYTDNICTTALPITLLSFNATYNADTRAVNLDWVTGSETNNKSFTVQRTQDGINWEDVVTVPGAGNSTKQLNYAAVDEDPHSGVSYYRLKQTDDDGNYTYPGLTATVTIGELQLKGIYVAPDPASQLASVTFDSPVAGNATLSVYSCVGRLMDSKQISMIAGSTTSALDVSGYANGVYIVVINNGAEQYSAKLIVNHIDK